MEYKLFINPWEGLGFVLHKRLTTANLEFEYMDSRTNLDEFRKYGVKSTPVLLILDNDGMDDKLVTVDEIVDFFQRNVSCK